MCHVYEIGEADGQSFIAMPIVEGESLDGRCLKGRVFEFLADRVCMDGRSVVRKAVYDEQIRLSDLVVAGE